ncbi:MAG: RNA polymerase sporulation sigma factor SigK [Erysipelotrichaceae bacterium]
MFTMLFTLLSSTFLYVGYLKNNSFAQPLNKEDELKYINLMDKGDHNARNTLIEHNLRLVAHIVKKYDFKKELNEDLISIGTIGLIKGVDSFKSETGHKLTTYIARCIENEILMYLRANKNYFKNISLNEPISNDSDGNEITLLDALAAPKERSIIDQIELDNNIKLLRSYLYVLDERELEIITRRFGLFNQIEQTQKQIAKDLSISRSYVSRIEKRSFVKIYREFQKHQNKSDT